MLFDLVQALGELVIASTMMLPGNPESQAKLEAQIAAFRYL